MKKALLAVAVLGILGSSFLLAGCNAQQTANDTITVINAILTVAQDEVPSIPAADQTAYKNWVSLGQTLSGQASTCVAASGSTTSKLGACFVTLASGLTSPAELQQLHLMSASSQSTTQKVAQAIIIGVNGALTAWKLANQPTPAITVPATTAEMRSFARANNFPAYGIDYLIPAGN